MKSLEFGSFIKSIRESKNIPQRIVAHALDIDTSTLSKMEIGERKSSTSMVKPVALSLDFNYKELQIRDIIEKIKSELNNQPYLLEALKVALEELDR